MLEWDHDRYMRRAIDLTAHVPELPFAAVIVDREREVIVAEGWNKSSMNPTWHGEIDAINALVRADRLAAGGELIMYTTAEPCPMCMGAILWSGINIVVFGSSIRFLLDTGWRQLDISAQEVANRSPGWRCCVIGGVLETECNELFLTVSRPAPGW